MDADAAGPGGDEERPKWMLCEIEQGPDGHRRFVHTTPDGVRISFPLDEVQDLIEGGEAFSADELDSVDLAPLRKLGEEAERK